MVPIKFTSLILGLLLVSLVLNSSIASTDTDPQAEVSYREELSVIQKDDTSANQGKKIGEVATLRNIRLMLKGRKMVMDDEIRKAVKEDTSKISGNVECASMRQLKVSQAVMGDKKSSNEVKPMAPSSGDMKVRSNHESLDLANSPATSFSSSYAKSSSPANAEGLPQTSMHSQEFFKAAMDTLNMLSMDYNHKPRLKPPINNNEPRVDIDVINP